MEHTWLRWQACRILDGTRKCYQNINFWHYKRLMNACLLHSHFSGFISARNATWFRRVSHRIFTLYFLKLTAIQNLQEQHFCLWSPAFSMHYSSAEVPKVWGAPRTPRGAVGPLGEHELIAWGIFILNECGSKVKIYILIGILIGWNISLIT
jgi:hypothetical protein